jgi:hypothetical protein
VKWGSLFLGLSCLAVAMVPWVEGAAEGICLFAAGMNINAFFESIRE